MKSRPPAINRQRIRTGRLPLDKPNIANPSDREFSVAIEASKQQSHRSTDDDCTAAAGGPSTKQHGLTEIAPRGRGGFIPESSRTRHNDPLLGCDEQSRGPTAHAGTTYPVSTLSDELPESVDVLLSFMKGTIDDRNPDDRILPAQPPYQIRAPSPAPLIGSGHLADLRPWTRDGREDGLDANAIKRGFDICIDETALTVQSAKNGLWPVLRHQTGVALLNCFFEKISILQQQRGVASFSGVVISSSRVTFTEAKRDVWFRDLADTSKEICSLLVKIPRGVSGRMLLDQCLGKCIPIPRAVILIKTIGGTELRDLRKAITPAVLGEDLRQEQWLREWTNQVFAMLRAVSAQWNHPDSDERTDLVLRLARAIRQEQLLHLHQYCLLILDAFSTSQGVDALFWIVVIQGEWDNLCRMRCRATKLLQGLLVRSKTSIFSDCLRRLFVMVPDAFVTPLWRKYESSLLSLLPVSISRSNVASRNQLFCPDDRFEPDQVDAVVNKAIEALDAFRGEQAGPLAIRLASVQAKCPSLGFYLLDWATSRFRPGRERVYLLIRVLEHWRSAGSPLQASSQLVWLAGILRHPDPDSRYRWPLICLLFAEASRRQLISPDSFLRWLITRGGLPLGQSNLREILLSFSFATSCAQSVTLRRSMLRRSGYTFEVEEHATTEIDYAWTICDACGDDPSHPRMLQFAHQVLITLNRLEGLHVKWTIVRQIMERISSQVRHQRIAYELSCRLLLGVNDLACLTELCQQQQQLRNHHSAADLIRFSAFLQVPDAQLFDIRPSCRLDSSTAQRLEDDISHLVLLISSPLEPRDSARRLPSDPLPAHQLPPSPWSNPPDSSSPLVGWECDASECKEGPDTTAEIPCLTISLLLKVFSETLWTADESLELLARNRLMCSIVRSRHPDLLLTRLITHLESSASRGSGVDEDGLRRILLSDALSDLLCIQILCDWHRATKLYVGPLLSSLASRPDLRNDFAHALNLPNEGHKPWQLLRAIFADLDMISLPFHQTAAALLRWPDSHSEAAVPTKYVSPVLGALLGRALNKEDDWLKLFRLLPSPISSSILDHACRQYEQSCFVLRPKELSSCLMKATPASTSEDPTRRRSLQYLLRKCLPIISCTGFQPLVLHLTEYLHASVQILRAVSLESGTDPSPPLPNPLRLEDLTPVLQLIGLIPLVPSSSLISLQQSPLPRDIVLAMTSLYQLLSYEPSQTSLRHRFESDRAAMESVTIMLYDTLSQVYDSLSHSQQAACIQAMVGSVLDQRLRFLFGSDPSSPRLQGLRSRTKRGSDGTQDDTRRSVIRPWDTGLDLSKLGIKPVMVRKGG